MPLKIDAYPFDKLFSVIIDDTLRKADLAKTNVLIHLLGILGIKRAPSTTHLE